MSLEKLFEEVRFWQRETFPKATAKSAANHLLREAKELLEDPTELSELADVIILAIGVADQLEVNIEEIVGDKLKINQERVWGESDAEGVVEHVRGEDENPIGYIDPEEIEYNPKKLAEYANSLLPQSQKSKEKLEELGIKAWEIRMRFTGELPG